MVLCQVSSKAHDLAIVHLCKAPRNVQSHLSCGRLCCACMADKLAGVGGAVRAPCHWQALDSIQLAAKCCCESQSVAVRLAVQQDRLANPALTLSGQSLLSCHRGSASKPLLPASHLQLRICFADARAWGSWLAFWGLSRPCCIAGGQAAHHEADKGQVFACSSYLLSPERLNSLYNKTRGYV